MLLLLLLLPRYERQAGHNKLRYDLKLALTLEDEDVKCGRGVQGTAGPRRAAS